MAGVTVHVIGLGYVLLVVDTVEVVDHVRASIVCAGSGLWALGSGLCALGSGLWALA